jgi:hypothetical protein
MPGVNFRSVGEQIALRDVLRLWHCGARVVRGDQGRGPCPVRGSNPQGRWLSVDGRLGRYHCLVCGSRGNALELWSAVRGVNPHAASVELCRLLGIEVPRVKRR